MGEKFYPIIQFDNTLEDLFFWTKEYLNYKLLTLDKRKIKDNFDVVDFSKEILKTKDIEEYNGGLKQLDAKEAKEQEPFLFNLKKDSRGEKIKSPLKKSNPKVPEYLDDNIFIEDLNMKAMQMMWGRKISDLGFSEFVNILEYKTNVVKIDRFFPSSKTCSCCGYVLKELDLNTREWTCPSCQVQHQRDVNAAINIKRVGTSTLRGETVRLASAS